MAAGNGWRQVPRVRIGVGNTQQNVKERMYGAVESDDTEITTYTATKKETARVAVYVTVTAADGVSGTGATSMKGQQRGLSKGRTTDGRQWGRGSTRAKLVQRRPRSRATGSGDSTPALTRPASAPTDVL